MSKDYWDKVSRIEEKLSLIKDEYNICFGDIEIFSKDKSYKLEISIKDIVNIYTNNIASDYLELVIELENATFKFELK